MVRVGMELERGSVQERVLLYLRENGPIKWPTLYLYFDQDGKGEIGSVLQVLAIMKEIELEGYGYVQITQAGIERIANGK